MTKLEPLADLLGRLLISTLFLLAGIGKLSAYAGTQAYMTSVGVPGPLLPLVIGLEILGAAAIILGWQTRVVALLLAGFSVVSAALFHRNFADQIQQIMFLKT